MARYRTSDNTVVDTKNASERWEEQRRFDGSNHISVATGSQWEHQTLYRSRRGRYYIEHTSQWEGSTGTVEWVSVEEAARWLLTNERDIPNELVQVAEQVSE